MFNRFIDTARTQRGSRDGHKLTLDLSGPGVVASLVFTLLCTASAAAPAQTPTQSTSGTSPSVLTLPPGAAPLPVEIAFHLFDLQGIDDEAEAFEFSGELKLVWRDARQAFDPAVEGATLKVYSGNYQFNELAPAWYPQVVLANALGMPESQGVLLEVHPDGTCVLVQMLNARARTRLDLHRYPFDKQQLSVVFEVLGYDSKQVVLRPNGAGATVESHRTTVPQWTLLRVSSASKLVDAPFANTGDSAAFVVTLDVDRRSFFMVRLVILPLALIVVLSWSVFWMDKSSLGDRMAVSFVGILTAVAYQIMVSDIMPNISYITFMNGFLFFSLLVMSGSVLVNLEVGSCDRRGDHQRGDKIDRFSRRFFPLLYASLIAVALILSFTIF